VIRPLVIALCALASVTARARAQDTTAFTAVVIFAEVSAREVRFTKQPTIRVVLANGTVDSVRVIERRNLPDPVQPGVTYRDVAIAVEIIGRLNAECLAARITRQTVPACSAARPDSSRRSPP
jgi:hypothetical protein